MKVNAEPICHVSYRACFSKAVLEFQYHEFNVLSRMSVLPPQECSRQFTTASVRDMVVFHTFEIYFFLINFLFGRPKYSILATDKMHACPIFLFKNFVRLRLKAGYLMIFLCLILSKADFTDKQMAGVNH